MEYTAHNLNSTKFNGDEIRNIVKKIAEGRTAPLVFIRGRCVGGKKELESLYISGCLHHDLGCLFCNEYDPPVSCCKTKYLL